MVKIILMGRCCRISFDMIEIQLKSETSLFEWVWTDTLSDINFIIEKLIKDEPIKINRIDGNNYMEGTNIKTSHYINRNYEEIVLRRSQRLMNDIKNEEEILFIRDDKLSTIRFEEIEDFFKLIRSINPSLSFKMLLLSDKEHFNEFIYPNLYHKIYDKSLYKTYINECYHIFENK